MFPLSLTALAASITLTQTTKLHLPFIIWTGVQCVFLRVFSRILRKSKQIDYQSVWRSFKCKFDVTCPTKLTNCTNSNASKCEHISDRVDGRDIRCLIILFWIFMYANNPFNYLNLYPCLTWWKISLFCVDKNSKYHYAIWLWSCITK